MAEYLRELEEEKRRIEKSLLNFALTLGKAKNDNRNCEKSIKIFFDTFETRSNMINELLANS